MTNHPPSGETGQALVHEILGEMSPISAFMEVRQERDLALKAVRAFMFCEQSIAGRNPHTVGTNRYAAFDLGMAVLSMPCTKKEAPRDCRCGHTKAAHYNGLGMCRELNGTGHACHCQRYRLPASPEKGSELK